MDLRKLIDDYIEINHFEIKYKDKKIKVFYYNKIEIFTPNLIEIISNNEKIKIKGNNLVIETMFKEYLIIGGNIKSIDFIYA